jgi:hypothetical protein
MHLTGQYITNTKDDSHFHSHWLALKNLMPKLTLDTQRPNDTSLASSSSRIYPMDFIFILLPVNIFPPLYYTLTAQGKIGN